MEMINGEKYFSHAFLIQSGIILFIIGIFITLFIWWAVDVHTETQGEYNKWCVSNGFDRAKDYLITATIYNHGHRYITCYKEGTRLNKFEKYEELVQIPDQPR